MSTSISSARAAPHAGTNPAKGVVHRRDPPSADALPALSQNLEQREAVLELLVDTYVLEDSLGLTVLGDDHGHLRLRDVPQHFGGMRLEVADGLHRLARLQDRKTTRLN